MLNHHITTHPRLRRKALSWQPCAELPRVQAIVEAANGITRAQRAHFMRIQETNREIPAAILQRTIRVYEEQRWHLMWCHEQAQRWQHDVPESREVAAFHRLVALVLLLTDDLLRLLNDVVVALYPTMERVLQEIEAS